MQENFEIMLSVDLGTGGPKVALVTTDGHVVASELTPITTQRIGRSGATQNPLDWWQAIVGSTRNLLSSGEVKPDQIVGIATTGQWGSTVPVDVDGQPAGDCMLWMDSRGYEYSRSLMAGPTPFRIEGYGIDRVLKFIRKSSGAPALQGNDPLGHYLFMKNELPDIFENTAYFLEPVDFISLCFTGVVKATPASMILSWIVDIRNLGNAKYAKDLIRITKRDFNKVPELVPTGSIVGTICKKASDELGIKEGLPVVSGIPDLLSAPPGSGGMDDYDFHLAISTSSWMSCHVPYKKTDPFRQIATVPGVMPGKYLIANNHDTAGITLEWLRDILFSSAQARPKYSEIDSLIEKVPAGSGGIIFTPWLTGERCPVDDRTLRGSFLNLSLDSTKDEMIRSLYEGVAFNARWMQDAVEKFIKRKVGSIRFIGGGASSKIWCQIHADILEREVHQVKDPLVANVRGVALYGAMALKKTDATRIKASVKVDEVFSPNKNNQALYRELYGIYKGLYKKQHKMYATLNRSSSPITRSKEME
ncbi:MAG: hypothetical protein HKL80_06045 [Acidimicrobiales bacterium]|nr:hypothetical protein [Acidimicrobiales bacterium]